MKKKIIFSICLILIIIVTTILLVCFIFKPSNNDIFTHGKVTISLSSIKDTEEKEDYQLIPGKKYYKESIVTIKKGSLESYVRILVTIKGISTIEEITNENFNPEKYVTGWNKEKWPCVNVYENKDDSKTYEFRYYKTVDASKNKKELTPLFEYFTIPIELTKKELMKLKDFEVDIEAHVTQANGLDSADEAWNNFKKNNN